MSARAWMRVPAAAYAQSLTQKPIVPAPIA